MADVNEVDIELAAQLLGVDYRVGPHELSALRVLLNDTVPEVLLAMLDPDVSGLADLEPAGDHASSDGRPRLQC